MSFERRFAGELMVVHVYRIDGILLFLFDLILYVPFKKFQLCWNGSSLDELVLSKDKCVLFKDTKQ